MKKNQIYRCLQIIIYFLLLGHLYSCKSPKKPSQKINIIKKKCPQLFSKYSYVINGYKIRIKPIVKKYGCNTIPIINKIILEKKFYFLDLLEDNNSLNVDQLILLLTYNRNFTKILILNSQIFLKYIKNLTVKNRFKFYRNLNLLIKKHFHLNDKELIKSDSVFLEKYFIIAMLSSENNIEMVFNLLTSKLTTEDLKILVSFADLKRIENIQEFIYLFNNLDNDSIRKIVDHKEYVSYFLPPQIGILKNFDSNISLKNVKKIKQLVLKEIYFLFERLLAENYSTEITLRFIEEIYPYIIEYTINNINSIKSNIFDFKFFFKYLIKNSYIDSIFIDGKCSINSSKFTNIIFSKNGIYRGIKFYKKVNINNFFHNLPKQTIYSLYYLYKVINYHAQLYSNNRITKQNKENYWKMYLGLLENLSSNYEDNLYFIDKLLKINYFKQFKSNNFNDYIEEDEKTLFLPKYIYILKIPYPSRMSPSIFDYTLRLNNIDMLSLSDGEKEKICNKISGILSTNKKSFSYYLNIKNITHLGEKEYCISKLDDIYPSYNFKKAIIELINQDNKELSNHRFKTIEKVLEFLDQLDNILDIIQLVNIPIGISKFVVKKVAKEFAEKTIKRISKNLGKKIAVKMSKSFFLKTIKISDKLSNSLFPYSISRVFDTIETYKIKEKIENNTNFKYNTICPSGVK